mmetsp:Transcript_97543/g.168989  ORF Transcript_97543/g.168989 Transcript_97543/m.168989 type:complete len:206 (-) Transcript_97543:446-1063(-)
MHDNVHWLRVGCSVAEGLHHEVCGKAQASQVFELIPGHGTSGILAPHSSHLRLDVHPRDYAGKAASFGHHLLRKREAGNVWDIAGRGAECGAWRQAQSLPSPISDLFAYDERNTATSLDRIIEHRTLELKFCQYLIRAMLFHDAFVWVDVNNITHIHPSDITFYWQCTSILQRVEEDWCNLVANAHTAEFLVGHVEVLISHHPKN